MCFDFVFWASELFGSEPAEIDVCETNAQKRFGLGVGRTLALCQGKEGR
jgi:hypothetical protein